MTLWSKAAADPPAYMGDTWERNKLLISGTIFLGVSHTHHMDTFCDSFLLRGYHHFLLLTSFILIECYPQVYGPGIPNLWMSPGFYQNLLRKSSPAHSLTQEFKTALNSHTAQCPLPLSTPKLCLLFHASMKVIFSFLVLKGDKDNVNLRSLKSLHQ